jgi:SAM-dependent methyltransferase
MSQEGVRQHYAHVAQMVRSSTTDATSGFHIVPETRSSCSLEDRSEAFNIYEQRVVEGIPKKALIASRGCGDPVAKAQLRAGESVLDLGCGGGIDAIIASRLVGEDGHVFGLDMTAEMLELARENAEVAQAFNITYIEGMIEDIPLPDEAVDVVLSNCVINFSEDRPAVFREAFRVLKPGGRFVVSDIVEFEPIPPEARDDLCIIVGTTNGMLAVNTYAQLLEAAGFASAEIEPKTVYTRSVLLEKAQRKERLAQYERIAHADIDAKTGSAIITARK